MDIYERIRQELKKAYDTSNQTKIADIAGVSQPTVGRYLASSDAIKAMCLETFFALFPNADIVFNKPTDEALARRLHSFIDKLSDQDKEKAWAVLSAVFPQINK